MQGLEKTEIPAQEFFYFLSIYSWQMPSLGPSLSGKWEWKVTCQAGTSTCPGQQAYLYCRHCLHFPSIRTTLHREGIKLNTNWPKTFKEFVKLSNWWNVWLLGYTIRGEIGFQKLHDFHRAHTFFVKKKWQKKYSIHCCTLGSNSLGSLILLCGHSIFRNNVLVAPSETVSLMLMRQISWTNILLQDGTFYEPWMDLCFITSHCFIDKYLQSKDGSSP